MAGFPGLARKFIFGCPSYFGEGKMVAVLHQDRIVLRLAGPDLAALVAKGVPFWSPGPGRVARGAVVVPNRVGKSPRAPAPGSEGPWPPPKPAGEREPGPRG